MDTQHSRVPALALATDETRRFCGDGDDGDDKFLSLMMKNGIPTHYRPTSTGRSAEADKIDHRSTSFAVHQNTARCKTTKHDTGTTGHDRRIMHAWDLGGSKWHLLKHGQRTDAWESDCYLQAMEWNGFETLALGVLFLPFF